MTLHAKIKLKSPKYIVYVVFTKVLCCEILFYRSLILLQGRQGLVYEMLHSDDLIFFWTFNELREYFFAGRMLSGVKPEVQIVARLK